MKIGVYSADGQLQSEHDVEVGEQLDIAVEPNGAWAQLVSGQLHVMPVSPNGLTLRGLLISA